MTLIFCGLQNSGKSTLGALVAEKINFHFIDVDELIERSYFAQFSKKYSCREIYKYEGTLFFRSLEKEQIASLNEGNHVIAIGGGAFLEHENIEKLKGLGKIIYLKVPLEILYERSIKNGLPAFLKNNSFEEFKKIANMRIPLFEKYATTILDINNKSISQILDEIRKIIDEQ